MSSMVRSEDSTCVHQSSDGSADDEDGFHALMGTDVGDETSGEGAISIYHDWLRSLDQVDRDLRDVWVRLEWVSRFSLR